MTDRASFSEVSAVRRMGIASSKWNGGLMLADVGGLGIAILVAVVLAALGIIVLISRPRTH
jgi:hypothetical protein